MLSFVFIRPISAHSQFEEALIGDDAEALLRYSAPLEKAFCEIKEWTLNEGHGRVLTSFGNQIGIQIPADCILKLSEFAHKYELSAKTKLAIGIGITPIEAYKAMQQSELEGGHRIVLYSKELDTEGYGDLVEDEDDLSKNGYELRLPFLEKEDIEFKQAIDHNARNPVQVTGGASNDPQVNEVNSATPSREMPISDQPKMGPSHDVVSSPRSSQSTKQKVLEALSLVKHYSVDIMRLKEINPKAFDAIKKLIDSMIKMAQTHGEMVKTEEIGQFLELLNLAKALPRSHAENLENMAGFLNNPVSRDNYMEQTGAKPQVHTTSKIHRQDRFAVSGPVNPAAPISGQGYDLFDNEDPQIWEAYRHNMGVSANPHTAKGRIHNYPPQALGAPNESVGYNNTVAGKNVEKDFWEDIDAMTAGESLRDFRRKKDRGIKQPPSPATAILDNDPTKKAELDKCDFTSMDSYFNTEENPSEAPKDGKVLDKSLQGQTVPPGHRTGNKIKMKNGHWHQMSTGGVMGPEGVPQSPGKIENK
jgi:hypothetical protein